MSDEQTLLAVIAIIYLADCVYWIPRQGLSFTRWVGKFWKLRAPSTIIGNERGAFGFANPLPPLGVATRAAGWTISISERGVFSQAGHFEWGQINKVERDEKKIFINEKYFATAASAYSARRMAKELARLQKVSEQKRRGEIESAIGESCDLPKIKKRVEEFLKRTGMLRYLSNMLFLFLFAMCPYMVWRVGLVAALWPMVFGIYAQTILIALYFSKLHREIYPADSDQVFKPFLTMLLAAPSAMRAQDILGRPLLEEFHPLAVAKALCAPEEVENLAGVVIRDLHFPSGGQRDLEFRETLLKTLRRKLSLDDAKWLKAPERSETVNTKYCPRCLQQFTEAGTACSECRGRELVKF